MSTERWTALMDNDLEQLTAEELADGWHFCWEWDGLLVGPNMGEIEFCECPYPGTRKAKAEWLGSQKDQETQQ